MTKIATWNVNSLKVRLPHVLEWCESAQPDILALQETKTVDEKFPAAEIEAAGYHVVYAGQPTYNGVALLSKTPITLLAHALPNFEDIQKRFLSVKIGDIHVVDVYVPNGQAVGSEKYQYKLAWLEALQQYVREALTDAKHFVMLGDYNIAPADEDVYDPVAWGNEVLCSEKERAALKALMDLGLKDAFRLFDQPANKYSWWDYRQLAFVKNRGLRIDHLLVNASLAAACQRCEIDRTPRKWEKPSDHAPVWAEFKL